MKSLYLLFLHSFLPFLLSPDPSLVLSPTHWPRHTIDDSSSGADGVKLADWNEDGLPDIVTGWEEGGLAKVYLHPGKEHVRDKWEQMTVGKTPSVEDAVFVDLDGESPLEVLSCTEGKERKLYTHWANPRGKEVEWRQQSVAVADGLMQWMYAIPFSLGPNKSVIVAAGKGKEAAIGWLEIPANPRAVEAWKWHPIGQVGWIMSIIPADMDRDGDLDLLISDRRGPLQACRWLENRGPDRWEEPWPNHWIGAKGKEVMFIDWVDWDGDGIREVLAVDWTDTQISIFKPNKVQQQAQSWTTTHFPIPPDMERPKSIVAGDLNGDNVLDLILSSNTGSVPLDGLVWLNGKDLASGTGATFQSISGNHIAKYDKVELVDLDQDGDLDILICEENYGTNSEGLGVIWYENQLKK
ncbi:MAG: VCBS repeat-containing protein [Saprospiraceae bacterium]|nr:VCBS repeat-containing protein [Saprospiraceae bacterium]